MWTIFPSTIKFVLPLPSFVLPLKLVFFIGVITQPSTKHNTIMQLLFTSTPRNELVSIVYEMCRSSRNVGSVVCADVLALLHKEPRESFGEGAVHTTGNKKKTKEARSHTTQIHTTVGLIVKPHHCLAVAIILPHPFLVSFVFYLTSFH